MSADVTVAVIAGFVSLIGAAISAVISIRNATQRADVDEKLARLKGQIDQEAADRAAQRREQMDERLARLKGEMDRDVASARASFDRELTEQKAQLDHKALFAAERVARELMMDREWHWRSFRVIKHHLGGWPDEELRQILVRAGAIRTKGADGQEVWGLLDRNRDKIGIEQLQQSPGYRPNNPRPDQPPPTS